MFLCHSKNTEMKVPFILLQSGIVGNLFEQLDKNSVFKLAVFEQFQTK
jgi:hypothetical protein